jgi:hypothetical protein
METPSIQVGIVDRIIKDAKSKPDGELVMVGLTSSDLKDVLADLLKSSASVPGLRINPSLNVEIKQKKGLVKGNISVDHDAVGHSEAFIDLVFGNSTTQKNVIVTEKRDVKANLSLRAKLALSAAGINLENELNLKLGKPYDALNLLMGQTLRQNGLKLDAFGTLFSDQDKLILAFKSHKM